MPKKPHGVLKTDHRSFDAYLLRFQPRRQFERLVMAKIIGSLGVLGGLGGKIAFHELSRLSAAQSPIGRVTARELPKHGTYTEWVPGPPATMK